MACLCTRLYWCQAPAVIIKSESTTAFHASKRASYPVPALNQVPLGLDFLTQSTAWVTTFWAYIYPAYLVNPEFGTAMAVPVDEDRRESVRGDVGDDPVSKHHGDEGDDGGGHSGIIGRG
jgi:hypothetical protein